MRKMKSIFALCLSLIMIILTVGGITTVSAASIDAAAYFNAAQDGFVVEGTVTNSNVDEVSIAIYRPGYTIEMVEDGSATAANAISNISVERIVNGEFTYSCKASAKDTTGYYTVYINYGGEQLKVIENVYYAVAEDVESTIDTIEAITGTPEEKLAAFTAVADKLGQLPASYEVLSEEQKADTIDRVIAEGVEFASVEDLLNSIDTESVNVVILAPTSKESVKYVVENYNDRFGYDFNNAFYKKYVEGYANRVEAVYAYTASKAPFTDTTAAKDAFQQGVILQALNNITAKGELYNRAMNSVSILGDAANVAVLTGIDMTGYKNLTDVRQESMLTAFFTGGKHKVATVEAFVSNWNAAVKSAASSVDAPVSGGGGGGGGAGGSIPNDTTSVTVGGNVSTGIQGGATPTDKTAEEAPYFADLASAEWAADSITALAKAGIVNGKDANNFAPNDNITREEFLKMLYLCANLPVNEEAQTTFIDVNKGDWYYGVIASAQEQGLVNGVSNVQFGVGENITRQDMAVMIVRMISSLGIELELSADESTFADNASIASYANVSVYTMKRAGIINGYEDGSFGPNAYATRAEAAKIIYALCSLMVD